MFRLGWAKSAGVPHPARGPGQKGADGSWQKEDSYWLDKAAGQDEASARHFVLDLCRRRA